MHGLEILFFWLTIYWITPFILILIGIILLASSKKSNAMLFFIAAVLMLLIGIGFCGLLLMG
jgi:hypothetical protein